MRVLNSTELDVIGGGIGGGESVGQDTGSGGGFDSGSGGGFLYRLFTHTTILGAIVGAIFGFGD